VRAALAEELGGIERVGLRDLPDPTPAAGQVLVGVHAAGVGLWDVGFLAGGFPGLTLPFVLTKFPTMPLFAPHVTKKEVPSDAIDEEAPVVPAPSGMAVVSSTEPAAVTRTADSFAPFGPATRNSVPL